MHIWPLRADLLTRSLPVKYTLSLATVLVAKVTCARCVSVCLSITHYFLNRRLIWGRHPDFLPLESTYYCILMPPPHTGIREKPAWDGNKHLFVAHLRRCHLLSVGASKKFSACESGKKNREPWEN